MDCFVHEEEAMQGEETRMLDQDVSPMRRVVTMGLSLVIATAVYPVAALAAVDEVGQVEPVMTEVSGEAEPEVVETEGALPEETGNSEGEEAPVEEPVLVASSETEEVPNEEPGNPEEEASQEGVTKDEEPLDEEPALQAAATTGDLEFAYATNYNDEQYARVVVRDVQSGTVTFDESTNTLTLDNAVIGGDIETYLDLTINLVGESTCNEISEQYDDYGGYGSYTLTGSGSLKTADGVLHFAGYSVSSVSSGTVTFDDSTNILTLDNAVIDDGISIHRDITIRLVGTSVCNDGISCDYLSDEYRNAEYVFEGSGQLRVGDAIRFAGCSVSSVSSGTVTFDDSTSTLTLDNAVIDGSIYISRDITICLTGTNSCNSIDYDYLYDEGRNAEYKTEGKGLLRVGNTVYCGAASVYLNSGNATYDAQTGALVLEDANVDDISVDGTATIRLVGENVSDNGIGISDTGKLTIQGSGSLKTYSVYDTKGTLEVKGGKLTVDYSIRSKKLIVSGGKVTASDLGYYDDPLDEVKVSAGELTAESSIRSKKLIVSGGKVTASELGEWNAGLDEVKMSNGELGVDYIYCKKLSVSGGKVTASYIRRGDGDNIDPEVAVSGGTLTVSGSVSCKSVTVRGGAVTADSIYCGSGALSVSGGEIVSTGRIECSHLSVSGGKATFAQIDSYYQNNKWFYPDVTLSGGTVKGSITAKTLTVSGRASLTCAGKSKDDYNNSISCESLVMKGGCINVSKCQYGVSATKSVSISGGTISVKNCAYGIHMHTGLNSGNFVQSGGTITASNCDNGIHLSNDSSSAGTAYLTLKKGAINVYNPSHNGIMLSDGNFTMSGGTVKITNAYEDGIDADDKTYRGKSYGGRVKITGGSLIITVRKPKDYSAIDAKVMSNVPASLKSIKGKLPSGARFKVGGNLYQVRNYNDAILRLYGSTKTAYSINRIAYGSYAYYVRGVGPNAFNTYRGKRVKSISFTNPLNYLGKGAFKNTVSLTNIKFDLEANRAYKNNKVTITRSSYSTFAGGCFAGMGKSKGRGLTVCIGYGDYEPAGFRTFMRKYGLSISTRVVKHG